MKVKILLLLAAILAIAVFFRAWQIGSIPPGLNIDEVSEGYNAYSLLKTGKDRYGMSFPVIFKSFGSYQPPIYTYLTVIPTFLFGPTISAVKTVSVVSGIISVIFTFFIIREFLFTKNDGLALLASLVVAVSPWAIFFSRIATEASPALALFVVGFYFILKSPKEQKFFPLATLFLGLATHAYYSERIISLLFLVVFIIINRVQFLRKKMWLITGLIVFGLIQVPNLLILTTGAFSRRLEQVTYLNPQAFEANGTAFKYIPFGREIYVIREFSSQYMAYFSPRNLFFIPDDQGARSIPDLSVFYDWMIIPYFFGFAYLIKGSKDYFVKNLFLLMGIAPIPAALTTDPFYTLRIFVLLWVLSIVISIGIWQIFEKIKIKMFAYGLLLLIFLVSFFTFYTHYFVLFKFERSNTVGYPDMELINITKERPNTHFVVDLSRDISNGMRFAYFRQYDPKSFQSEVGSRFLNKYYSSIDYEKEYKIDNVDVRPISWEKDVYRDQIIVGDTLTVSQIQVNEHKLKLEFEIKDMAGEVVLRGFSTNPKEKCLTSQLKSVYCKKWL